MAFFSFNPPSFLGMSQKSVCADIAHQLLPNDGHQLGECPATFYHALYQGDYQVGKHGRPKVNLNGIFMASQKILQREVLLEPLEQKLYLPPFFLFQFGAFGKIKN